MQISSYYQPIFHLYTIKEYGYEALLRPTPDLLFKQAAIINKTIELDAISMHMAIQGFKIINKKLFINAHPRTFMDIYTILSRILLKSTQIDPKQIVIEVTEHQELEDMKLARVQAERLRNMGVEVAIDDFGHGFTNLSLVEALHPRYIKLDRRLTKHITYDATARSLLLGIKKLADEIQANIIAEGIESAEQLEIIKSIGITFGQGWHLSRPIPLDQLESVSF